jgi:D-alanyl-lipoteichoic acid acyltransferase DltB (MBOAT superfamily)
LVFSTLLDFYSGVKISKANIQGNKKIWLFISVAINLGILGVFKYYNFFASSFADALSLLGVNVNMSSLEVILPVGISFYTFHGLSYVIDIYKNRIPPERNFIDYAVFVSYFPYWLQVLLKERRIYFLKYKGNVLLILIWQNLV